METEASSRPVPISAISARADSVPKSMPSVYFMEKQLLLPKICNEDMIPKLYHAAYAGHNTKFSDRGHFSFGLKPVIMWTCVIPSEDE